MSQDQTAVSGAVGKYSFDDYLELITGFHGYPAPGLILGGYMVEAARRGLPDGTLFDAVSETRSCLPDAIQLLTPCTVGNGWLKVMDLGRYALALYDKHTGEGFRVWLDADKLGGWPEYRAWFMKLKKKKDQDSDLLREEMRRAGESVLSIRPIRMDPAHMGHGHKKALALCPICGESYPTEHGAVCRGCQGQAPYLGNPVSARPTGASSKGDWAVKADLPGPRLTAVPAEQAVGRRAAHDMTRIEPGESKEALFTAGQVLTAGDVCELHRMGRYTVFVQDQDGPVGEDGEGGDAAEWVHEDQAAAAFAQALMGPVPQGVAVEGPPREGKLNLVATRPGLLLVDRDRLDRFNMLGEVMAATLHDSSMVKAGQAVAGTRALPLHVSRRTVEAAAALLSGDSARPPLSVLPLVPRPAGVLVTGTEVFQGLVKDKFVPIVTRKLAEHDCPVAAALIRPDDRQAIAQAVDELIDAGAELIVTTAGLSVDPGDVTRQALYDAGLTDALYGAPVLPGSMTLIGQIGGRLERSGKSIPVIGLPACGLFFEITAFDLLLPRVLAGAPIDRAFLARMGHGGLCKLCKRCTWPKCGFGK